MHLLARQLTALHRGELIPAYLIAQFPQLADQIALRWGEEELADYLLSLLVVDSAAADGVQAQVAQRPPVVRELMRLSVAYIELREQIAATRDVWQDVPEHDDLIINDGYIIERKLIKHSPAYTSPVYGQYFSSASYRTSPQKSWSPLMQLCFAGHTERVRSLLIQRPNIAQADADGHQAIHLAALQGYTDIVELLIKVGADLNAITARLNTPLILAAAGGHLAVVELLLEHDVSVNHARYDGRTALHQAAAYGHDAILVRLLQAKANPVLETTGGQTALQLLPRDKTRMADLLEIARPKHALRVLETRQVVSQPLIDWS
jgi:hypothetical protein